MNILRSTANRLFALQARVASPLRPRPSQWTFAAGAMLALAVPSAAMAQTISTFAGNGTAGFSGDGAAANAAEVRFPSGAAVDTAGNVYFADTANHRVRRIASGSGQITTVAGNGSMAYFGDGGQATAASLSFPAAVAVDTAGNLYIADTGNSRVRKVAPDGIITTVAGNGTIGFTGDDGPATAASLWRPTSVAFDLTGNLYIADTYNHRVRVVATATGVITTIAGTGVPGFQGDSGAAAAARLNYPIGVAFNPAGTLFVADTFNHRVRSVGGTTIATVAGNGTGGYSGDGAAATTASLHFPTSVASDSSGNLFVADFGNSRVRFVSATGGTITTFAGTGTPGFSGDGGDPTAAALSFPRGIAADSSDTIYVADSGNQRVRAIGAANSEPLDVSKSGSGSGTVTSSPEGIACGMGCFKRFARGTAVTLTATPGTGSTFSGWSGGGCSGTGTCAVTLNSATAVTASFTGQAVSSRPVNIATRGKVRTGANVLIAGFIIGGDKPKKVLVTARGPSVAVLPSEQPLLMADPTLVLYSGANPIDSNDDWQQKGNWEEIPLSIRPGNAKDAGILTTLAPGAYTVIVAGAGNTEGLGIVEVFEVDSPEAPLVNIATRGRVETGAEVLIAGFIIQGDAPRTVLVRARGQSTEVLPSEQPLLMADPYLRLYSGASVIYENDDWQGAVNTADGWGAPLPSTSIPLTQRPGHPKDAAVLVTLPPGAYTAIVTGVSDGQGIGIVEVFAQ